LASPNNYARTEMEETGTPNPKKITKVNTFLIFFARFEIQVINSFKN